MKRTNRTAEQAEDFIFYGEEREIEDIYDEYDELKELEELEAEEARIDAEMAADGIA